MSPLSGATVPGYFYDVIKTFLLDLIAGQRTKCRHVRIVDW